MNTYRNDIRDDLWRLTLRCVACILLPLCILLGITLGLQVGRGMGVMLKAPAAVKAVTP